MKYLLKFKNRTNEGVGDRYLSNRHIIEPEFSDFENKYKIYKSIENNEDIIFNDGKGFIIIKNPKSLQSIGGNVRGVIDEFGNLYVEQKSINVHDDILEVLDNLYLIGNDDYYWHEKIPDNFVCVQREKNRNLFLVSESYKTYKPTKERDYSIKNHWNKIPKLKEVIPVFQEFLDKAKIKNPKINFENIQIKNN